MRNFSDFNYDFVFTTVACAPGQYQTMAELAAGSGTTVDFHPVCQPCPLNTFENQEGSTMCQSCPVYHFTNSTGATSKSDCISEILCITLCLYEFPFSFLDIAEPLIMDCIKNNTSLQEVSIACEVNHSPSNFTCSFDYGPIRPCKPYHFLEYCNV